MRKELGRTPRTGSVMIKAGHSRRWNLATKFPVSAFREDIWEMKKSARDALKRLHRIFLPFKLSFASFAVIIILYLLAEEN